MKIKMQLIGQKKVKDIIGKFSFVHKGSKKQKPDRLSFPSPLMTWTETAKCSSQTEVAMKMGTCQNSTANGQTDLKSRTGDKHTHSSWTLEVMTFQTHIISSAIDSFGI